MSIPPHRRPHLIPLEPEARKRWQEVTSATAKAIQMRNQRRADLAKEAKIHQETIFAKQEEERKQRPREELARRQNLIHQQHLSPLNPNRQQMHSTTQLSSNFDGATWSHQNITEESSNAGASSSHEGNSSSLFVPMSSTSNSPPQIAPIAPMQPSPHVTNRHLNTPREDTPHSPPKIQTHISTREQSITQSRAHEAQMSQSLKRKRDSTDISNIIRTLERVDQQHNLDLADKESQIIRLKLQLSDMQNVDLGNEQPSGETMAQQAASMRSEIAGLKKAKMEAEYKITELCDQLQAKEDEANAFDDWTQEKAELKQKVLNTQEQLQSAQTQVHRFMDAFEREAELRKEVKGKLDTQEKFNAKLSKDLKKKNEELRAEMGGGSREKYARLSGAVKGLFAHKQMDAMSGEAFGDVGKALKRVKDLVKGDEQANGDGIGK